MQIQHLNAGLNPRFKCAVPHLNRGFNPRFWKAGLEGLGNAVLGSSAVDRTKVLPASWVGRNRSEGLGSPPTRLDSSSGASVSEAGGPVVADPSAPGFGTGGAGGRMEA